MDDPPDVEVNPGVEGLESFTLLKLLGVNVVLRRFLWFRAGGWRFLIICKYRQHKFAHGYYFYLAKRWEWKVSRKDGRQNLIYNIDEVIKTRKIMGTNQKDTGRSEAL